MPTNAPTPARMASEATRSGQRARVGAAAAVSPHSCPRTGRQVPHTAPAPVAAPRAASVVQPRPTARRTSPKLTPAQWQTVAASA